MPDNQRCTLRRFIPTSAGNISCCGRATDQCGGSSPRVRGTLPFPTNVSTTSRFIPTSAGNIDLVIDAKAPMEVHPHECGEHDTPEIRGVFKNGSSPRVRGTCAVHCGWVRFMTVHPHECGEHPHTGQLTVCPTGSSPRVRGTSD